MKTSQFSSPAQGSFGRLKPASIAPTHSSRTSGPATTKLRSIFQAAGGARAVFTEV